MISSRNELNEYLDEEKLRIPFIKHCILILKSFVGYSSKTILLISKYKTILRKYEYYHNNISIYTWIPHLYYAFRYQLLSQKLCIYLPINSIGKGLELYHTYKCQTMVRSNHIGEHVTIRSGLILAPNQFGHATEIESSPIVEDFVDFSFGVKAFGPIHIGRGALINANCVIVTDVPPYSIISGNPAKVIGFRASPQEILEFEMNNYPAEKRIPLSTIERNYKKYYLDRLEEIRKFTNICIKQSMD